MRVRARFVQISKYERVVNIPNSMTILYDMLPIAVTMSKVGVARTVSHSCCIVCACGQRKLSGTFNFTNPVSVGAAVYL